MGKKYYRITLYGTRENIKYVEEIYLESEGKVEIKGQILPLSASKSQLEEITKEGMEKVLKS